MWIFSWEQTVICLFERRKEDGKIWIKYKNVEFTTAHQFTFYRLTYFSLHSIWNLHISLANHLNCVNKGNIMTCCSRLDSLAVILQQTFSLCSWTSSQRKAIKTVRTNFLKSYSFVHRICFRVSFCSMNW